LYLNQAGYQPRERDYAYVGSFYAFAVWIGLGVVYIADMAAAWNKKIMKSMRRFLCIAWHGCIGKYYRNRSGLYRLRRRIGHYLRAGRLWPADAKYQEHKYSDCFSRLLAVPALMAQQEWDDHDRSQKQLPRDLAKDYLESCAPNAILFTYGDNDTYPLWYAQEVEGIRPDIRVVNFSLLGIDWYINELRYKVNQSDPVDVIWTPEQIEGGKRDYVVYRPQANIPENMYYDLYDMMKNYVGSDDPAKMDDSRGGDGLNTFPVRKLSVPVDKALVLKNGTVTAMTVS
jgi:hypothetical protein